MFRGDRRRDVGWALLRHGYGWSEVLRSAAADVESAGDHDVLPVRVLGRRGVVVRGPEGVRLFTDTKRVKRHRATPSIVGSVIFGRGAVHGLDDDRHVHRKELFVRATTPDSVLALTAEVDREWQQRLDEWASGQEVTVSTMAAEVIGTATIRWSGMVMTTARARRMGRRLARIVDGFGVLGPANLRARWDRRRADAWATKVVETARLPDAPASGTVLSLVAAWTELDGTLLPAHTAGVELQNLLRPTVAVHRFVAFGAARLAQDHLWRSRLAEERRLDVQRPGPLALAFAHEVRRSTPFVPALAAKARQAMDFAGQRLRAGDTIVLDVIGTLHDPRWWREPEDFDPGRFLDGSVVDDALVPQGGGSVEHGHRCPGEDVALGVLAVSLAAVAAAPWTTPAQDFSVSRHRLPTAPRSGVRLRRP